MKIPILSNHRVNATLGFSKLLGIFQHLNNKDEARESSPATNENG